MSSLAVAHLNTRSLLSGFVAFKSLIERGPYDIVALTETWLNPDMASELVHVDGFSLVRADRGGRGGGVAMYVSTMLSYSLLPLGDVNDALEHLWITFSVAGRRFALGAVYRPPRGVVTDFVDQLESVLSDVMPYCDVVLLTGDVNINLLNIDNSAVMLLDLFNSVGMSQLIASPTRITNISESLIDIIGTTDVDIVDAFGVVSVHGLSDHELVFCTFKLPIRQSVQYKTLRSFKQFNPGDFLADLYRVPFFNIFDIADINEKVAYLTNNILALMDIHAPLRSYRFTRPPAPWLTDTIKVMQRLRDKGLTDYRRLKTVERWNYYKQLRNFTNAAIDREKKAYMEYRITLDKKPWKSLAAVGFRSKCRVDIPIHLHTPNELNNFFLKTCAALDVTDLELYNFYNSNLIGTSTFSFELVNDVDIIDQINSITGNSRGSDGLTAFFVKLCSPHIVPYVRDIINTSLSSGIFPDAWKYAWVTPVPKKSNPSGFADLRPISVLPFLSKVAERIIFGQLNNFIQSNDILPETQSGFRKGYSCTTALMNVVDDVVRELDNGNVTVLCLLDYSKAFDTINHKLLRSILHHIGLDDLAVKLLYSYVTQRRQAVVIGDKMSEPALTTSGIAQGSVIGPLIYAIYTSQLQKRLNYCSVHFYADDTQLYCSFPSHDTAHACNKINSDLESIIEVSRRHGLHINSAKSELILHICS